MERESSDQNTRQTREESTATEQQLTSPDTSSRVLQRERISQAQERERPSESAAGSRTQTPRRPEDRAQRRHERTEKNCQIM